jgi:hypothetical protein
MARCVSAPTVLNPKGTYVFDNGFVYNGQFEHDTIVDAVSPDAYAAVLMSVIGESIPAEQSSQVCAFFLP